MSDQSPYDSLSERFVHACFDDGREEGMQDAVSEARALVKRLVSQRMSFLPDEIAERIAEARDFDELFAWAAEVAGAKDDAAVRDVFRGYRYQTPLIRDTFAKGRRQGFEDGLMASRAALLRVLAGRAAPVPPDVIAHILAADSLGVLFEWSAAAARGGERAAIYELFRSGASRERLDEDDMAERARLLVSWLADAHFALIPRSVTKRIKEATLAQLMGWASELASSEEGDTSCDLLR